MNSLYTLALRQSSSLSGDLQHLASLAQSNQLPASSAPIHQQIARELEQLDRTVADYDTMAQREIVPQIREKALARVDRFKREYALLDQEYKRLKRPRTLPQKSAADRSELLASSSSSVSHHPAAVSSSSSSSVHRSSASAQLLGPGSGAGATSPGTPQPRFTPNSPWVPSPSAYPTAGPSSSSASAFSPSQQQQQAYGGSYGYDARTDAALREHDFLGQTGQAIDAYLAQGQAVLGNLANQRDVLKGTRRRLLSAANTLGLSRSTITFIERRTRQDYYFLILGGLGTLVCFWLILKYLG
ncbi:hypothetical protein JCM3774_004885 [Rhodotorula dairenensis]